MPVVGVISEEAYFEADGLVAGVAELEQYRQKHVRGQAGIDVCIGPQVIHGLQTALGDRLVGCIQQGNLEHRVNLRALRQVYKGGLTLGFF